MAELSGAVDLSQIKGTLGPQESAALQAELRMMAQTRELALRDRAATEAENDGFNRLLAALVLAFGSHTADGGREIVLPEELAREAFERVASFHVSPEATQVRLSVLLVYPGRWEIGKREPTEEERDELAIYEELPEVSTRPGGWTAIVNTRKGLRIAEWRPE